MLGILIIIFFYDNKNIKEIHIRDLIKILFKEEELKDNQNEKLKTQYNYFAIKGDTNDKKV